VSEIDPQEFGRMVTKIDACAEGITDIKNVFRDHLKIYREDVRELHRKSDVADGRAVAAHSRMDGHDARLGVWKWIASGGLISGIATFIHWIRN